MMDETKFTIENECDKCADPAGIESSNDHGDEAKRLLSLPTCPLK